MSQPAAPNPAFTLLPHRRESLYDAVRSRVVLTDGAMGSALYAKGVYINQCFEALNIQRPHMVKAIHVDYLRAGAEVLETNTFGANRMKLARHGLADKVHEINLAGVRLAREAAGDVAWVAGAIGPPGWEEEAKGDTPVLRQAIREQAEALVAGGVDAIFLESFSHTLALIAAVEEVRAASPGVCVTALVHLDSRMRTLANESLARVAMAFADMKADIIGFNDGPGLAVLNAAVDQLAPLTRRPIALLPGTGFPVRHDDQTLHMATPEYFMELLRQGIQKGARLIGGSCGSDPQHIRAIKASVKMLQPAGAATIREDRTAPPPTRPAPVETTSRLAAKLRAGHFAVSVEIDPPVGTDVAPALAAAEECAAAGIDCVNIADGPRASARMGPIDMAILMRQRCPAVEAIVHFCCRDRNLLGMQADLIGANALGLANILVITGDPPKLGDYPYASAVYDVDAIGALGIVANLNAGRDLAGNPMKGPPTRLFAGCGANPGAIDLDHEVARLERKIERGAEYVLTQPVYDIRLFERFWSRIERLRVPVLIGILPLASLRNAEFLTKEVPGMQVPEPILARMRACGDKESARQTGIDIAREALSAALPHVAGTYIMPPFNRVDSALAVLEVASSRRVPAN